MDFVFVLPKAHDAAVFVVADPRHLVVRHLQEQLCQSAQRVVRDILLTLIGGILLRELLLLDALPDNLAPSILYEAIHNCLPFRVFRLHWLPPLARGRWASRPTWERLPQSCPAVNDIFAGAFRSLSARISQHPQREGP